MDSFVQVLGHAQADMSTTLHVEQADKLHQDAAVFGTLALCCVEGQRHLLAVVPAVCQTVQYQTVIRGFSHLYTMLAVLLQTSKLICWFWQCPTW
jgi:hypothetical protein